MTSLPAGLAFNTTSGQITGVPAAAGTYSIGLSATGPGGTGTATLTVYVSDPQPVAPVIPVINNADTAIAYVGMPFVFPIFASGSPTTYTATTLPSGLSFTDGIITGTPTTLGTTAVSISVTGPGGTGTGILTISVETPPLPIITSEVAAAGTTGSWFYCYIRTNLDGADGVAPTNYTVTNLPPGLSFTPTLQMLSGMPTTAGVYAVPISVTNVAGTRQAIVTVTISDPVTPAPTAAAPVLSSVPFAFGVAGTPFAYTLAASNAPTGFSASNLPAGITFTPASGVFAGAPTTAGTFLVPVTASNAYGTSTGTLTITVSASAAAQNAANGNLLPVITSEASACGYTGQALYYWIFANYAGGNAYTSDLSWTFSATGLPPGLSVTNASSNQGAGMISGTPTQTGTYQATISATCPANAILGVHPAATSTALVTFIIKAGPASSAPIIGGYASATTTVGALFYYNPYATNNPTSYAASGLPPGLSISATNGTVSGTPTAAGTYAATISASNSAGTGTATVSMIVAGASAPVITSSAVADGVIGYSFSYTISASGASNYSAANLPPGLSLNPSSGVLSGTPTQAGTFSVPIGATNAIGTANATLTVTIFPSAPTHPPAFTGAAVAQATVGSQFSYYFNTDVPAQSYTVGSALPPGVTAGANYISGTPTSAGTYAVPVSATNSAGTGTGTLTIVVSNPPAPVFESTCTLSAIVGQQLYSTVYIYGFVSSCTFSGLPPGVTQASPNSSALSGTPTTAGVYPVSVTASNAGGSTTVTLTITVTAKSPSPNLPIFLSGNPLEVIASLGTNSSFSILASPAITSYGASGLPPGLSLNTSSGVISGTPTTAGTYPISLSTSNAAGTTTAIITYVVASPVGQGPPSLNNLTETLTTVVDVPIATVSLNSINPAISFSASGLPPGLVLDTATGQITGAATAVGTYSVNLSASNAAGTGTAVWTVVVNDTAGLYPLFSNAIAEIKSGVSTGDWVEFNAYAYYGGSESSAPATITVSGLPAGCKVYSAGSNYLEIAVTPTTAGTYPLTLNASVPGGATTRATCMLVVGPPPALTVNSPAGSAGNVNYPFYYQLSASNTITSYGVGALPPGLTIDTSNWTISGTPTLAGTYTIPVTASGPFGNASAVITIRIDPPIFDGLPIIDSPAAISGQDVPDVGGPYYYPYKDPYSTTGSVTYALDALNGPVVWNVTNLPAGMNFNAFTGVMSGVPTSQGTFQVPVSATNSVGTVNATLTIISVSPLAVVDTGLARDAYVGAPYSDQLSTYYPALQVVGTDNYAYFPEPSSYSESDPMTFSAVGLPPGLTLNCFNGVISGTPVQAGTYPVVFTVTNRSNSSSVVSTFSITSTAPAPAAPTAPAVFSTGTQAAGFVGIPLNISLSSSGATSYTASGLPSGIALDPVNGLLSGTPASTGVWPVTISASNSVGSTQAVLTLTVDAAPPAPSLNGVCSATTSIGVPFTYTINAENFAGEPAPVIYSAVGLPAGLILDPATGIISGAPAGPAGTYQVAITAVVEPSTVSSGVLTLNVSAPVPVTQLLMSSAAGALGFVGDPFSYSIKDPGFAPTSALPAGLTYDSTSASISGYPAKAGTYSITMATAGGSSSASVSKSARAVASNTPKAKRQSIPISIHRSTRGTSDTSTTPSPVLTVRVVPPDFSLPRLQMQPIGGTAVEGTGFSLQAAAVGSQAPTYQWSHNGIPLSGATASSLNFSSLQLSDTGAYTVTASNAAGSVTSGVATLVVQTTYAKWQSDHFTAQEIAEGFADVNYSFSGDGVPNLLKYALDLDPRSNLSGRTLTTVSRSAADGLLQLGFMRDAGKTDVEYIVEASDNLLEWTPIAEGISGGSVTGTGSGAASVMETAVPGTSAYQVTVEASPPTGVSQFLRLRVVRQ